MNCFPPVWRKRWSRHLSGAMKDSTKGKIYLVLTDTGPSRCSSYNWQKGK